MMGMFDCGSSREFWVQNLSNNNRSSFMGYGWATLIALVVIIIFHSAKKFVCTASASSKRRVAPSAAVASDSNPVVSPPGSLQFRIPEIVSETDLKFLIENLDEKLPENEKWENVIERRNNHLFYSAKCCKPKDAPIKYLSLTVFENCPPEILRDFYMDNDYRKQWDKTLVEHKQLQVNRIDGNEIGRTIKKFPFLTCREYVLAWRLWEAKDKTFYCFIKECEHPLAPRQRKFVRVGLFRSGWRIRKVPNRNASEIKMFHQEDAGLNVEMAKLAFATGIWSYVCKMDNALHKYSMIGHPLTSSAVTAVSLIQKIPPELETTTTVVDTTATPAATAIDGQGTGETKHKIFARRPSRKVLANGLLLLGGIVCLSRGRSSLGAKVAMAYILTKMRKRDVSSSQRGER